MLNSTRRPATPDSLRSVRVSRTKLLARIKRDFKAFQAIAARAEQADRAERIRELTKELRELKAGRGHTFGYSYAQAEKDFRRMIDLLTASTAAEVVLRDFEAVQWAGEVNRHLKDARESLKRRKKKR